MNTKTTDANDGASVRGPSTSNAASSDTVSRTRIYTPLADECPKSHYRLATAIVARALGAMTPATAQVAHDSVIAVLPACWRAETATTTGRHWRLTRLRCDQEQRQLERVRVFAERFVGCGDERSGAATRLIETIGLISSAIAALRRIAPPLPSELKTTLPSAGDLALPAVAAEVPSDASDQDDFKIAGLLDLDTLIG